MTIIVLWGTLNSPNRGVNALTRSTIKCILDISPKEEIIVIGTDIKQPENKKGVNFIPIPNSKKLIKAIIFNKLGIDKKILLKLCSCNMSKITHILDLSAGDSFSDIYGQERFFSQSISKIAFKDLTKNYILLPQTFGPFSKKINKIIAANILKKTVNYARDFESQLYTEKISHKECGFCYDLAFIMDSKKPDIDLPSELNKKLGINVSGLLWNEGYSKVNDFSFKTDYRDLIKKIIEVFISKGIEIILIPHTYGNDCFEDDLFVSYNIQKFFLDQGIKIELIEENLDEEELKWIISQCDFFIGSRMHACIAALSKGIPAIGIAYSRKFIGVFNTINVDELVLDLRYLTINDIVDGIIKRYENRERYREKLVSQIPEIHREILRTMNIILKKSNDQQE